jgi:hypothetical protein
MKECEELRVVHMFLREATLTPFKHTPDYPRFKELIMNIFHFVGLGRAVKHTAKRVKEKFCEGAVRAFTPIIVSQCIQQLLREGVRSKGELLMLKKWVIKDYIKELIEVRLSQYMESVCKARCKEIQKDQFN